MATKGKQFKISLMIFVILLSTFFNGFGMVNGLDVVFAEDNADAGAEDTAEEGEVKNTIDSENVFSKYEGDGERSARLKSALKYNDQVQYLMTYTILHNQYLNSGAYANLYQGAYDTSAVGGTGGVSTPTVKMGYEEAILLDGETSDTPFDGGGSDKDVAEETAQKRERRMAFTVAEYLANIYLYMNGVPVESFDDYGLSSSETKSKSRYYTSIVFTKGNSGLGAEQTTLKNWGDKGISKNYDDYHSDLVNVRLNGDNEYFGDENKALLSPLFNALYVKASGLVENGGTYDVVSGLKNRAYTSVQSPSEINTELIKKYDIKITNSDNVSIMSTEYQASGLPRYVKTSVLKVSGSKNRLESEKDFKTVAMAVGVLENASSTAKSKMVDLKAKVESANKKNTQKVIDKYVSALKESPYYREFKDSQSLLVEMYKRGEEGTKGEDGTVVSTLGWLPLQIRIENTDENYLELLKNFDGGVYDSTTGKVTANDSLGAFEGRRALRINDIMAVEVPQETDSWSTRNVKSASPYLSYDFTNKRNYGNANAYIGSSTVTIGDSIGFYAGMKVEEVDSKWYESLWESIKGKSKTGIATPLTPADIVEDEEKSLGHMMYSYVASKGEDATNFVKDTSDLTLGIDNYGNIIVGNNLEVLVPYWHNSTIEGMRSGKNDDDDYFLSSPIFNNKDLKDDNLTQIVNGYLSNTSKSPVEAKANFNKVNDISLGYNQEVLSAQLQKISKSKLGDFSSISSLYADSTFVQAMAMAITKQTSSSVEKYNEKFLQAVEESRAVFMSESDGGMAQDTSPEDEAEEFNAKDLLEKIAMLFNGGFYELMRLTIASWVVSFYTSSVMNYSMSNIFHTDLITDSAMWDSLSNAVSTVLIGFVFVYLIFLGFKLFRGTVTGKDITKQFLMLTLSIVIPSLIYSPVVNFAINKPTSWLVGTQMEQQSLLDAYLYTEQTKREQDELYSQLFGDADEVRDRSEDYLITLYTTTHVDGYDVMDIKLDDVPTMKRYRVSNAMDSGKWRPSELISFKVSVFDVFQWVEETRDSDMTLFEWLGTNKADRYGDILQYKEYSVDTTVSYPDLNVNITGQRYTASELYKMIFNNMDEETTINNLQSLYTVSSAIRNDGKSTDEYSDRARELFVQDLAMTDASRDLLYGSPTSVSPSTTKILNDYHVNYEPNNDFLNLEKIVNQLVPYRDLTTTSLENDLYEINKEVIDNYITNYSLVRQATALNNQSYRLSEMRMVIMDVWFKVNDVLDLPLFPTTYEVDSLSLDSYVRLVYIPLTEMGDADDFSVENVSKYLTLRENPATLIFFFVPSLILLMVFGYLYAGMFSVVMLLLMMASFIINYVFRNNRDANMIIGNLTIIGSFSLAKIGLLIIWRLCSYFMNLSSASTGSVGGISYPYALIHSLFISIYLAIVIFLLMKYVITPVLKSPSDMGGHLYRENFNRLKTAIQSRSVPKIVGGGTGGHAVRDQLRGEGRYGRMLREAGSSLKESAINALISRNADKVGNVAESLETIEKGLNYATMSNGAEFAERFANMFGGRVQKAIARKLGQEYDEVSGSEVGLDKETQEVFEKNGEFGRIISSNDGGETITSLTTASPENAQQVAEHLNEKGLNAVAEGNKVLFNSTGYDLEDANVRKALYGGLVDKTLRETYDQNKVVDRVVEDVKDYNVNEDGTISFAVNDSALSPKALNELLESNVIRDNFAIVDTPVSRGGEFLNGTLLLKPKTNNVDVSEIASDMYTTDEHLRKRYNDKKREKSVFTNELTFDGEEEEILVRKLLEDGMKIQNGRILYDKKDVDHVKTVGVIRDKLLSLRDSKKVNELELMNSVMSHVTYGGDNGFREESVMASNSDDSMMSRLARSRGLITGKRKATVFAGKQAEEVATSISELSSIINASPKDLDKYVESKDNLFVKGEDFLVKRKGKEQFLKELINYSQGEKVEKEVTDKVSKEYRDLLTKRKRSAVTEKEFESELERLSAEMQTALTEKGRYGEALTNVIRTDISGIKKKDNPDYVIANELLEGYSEAKSRLDKVGVNFDVLDRLDTAEFDELGQLIGDIEEVKANKDGTINIVSQSAFSEEETKGLIKKINDIVEKKGKVEML